MLLFTCDFCNNCNSTFALPCLHTGCRSCMQNLSDKNTLATVVACPKCETIIPVSKDGVIEGLKLLSGNFDNILLGKGVAIKSCPCINSEVFVESETNCSSHNNSANGQQANSETLNEFYTPNTGKSKDSGAGKVYHYCCDCDMILCLTCINSDQHQFKLSSIDENKTENHTIVTFNKFAEHKRLYINELLQSLKKILLTKQEHLSQSAYMYSSLCESFSKIKDEINNRAQHLCDVIVNKKKTLLLKLDEIYEAETLLSNVMQTNLQNDVESMNDVFHFADTVSKESSNLEFINLHNDISSRLSNLTQQMEKSLQIFNIKFDIPDRGKEELYVDKLYGSLMQGDVHCGNTNLMTTFKSQLNWPVGMAITNSSDYIIAGKAGAFDNEAMILGYDRKGNLGMSYVNTENVLPLDIMHHMRNGKLLVSFTDGSVRSISRDGIVVDAWFKCFNSGGKMAEFDEKVYITSTDDACINIINLTGQVIEKLSLQYKEQNIKPAIMCGSNNYQKLAFTGQSGEKIYISDKAGNVINTINGTADNSFQFVCISAMCFDTFGNLLVADFTNDSIYIFSASGNSLGVLLTKVHGVSCPNCLSFDNDNHLLIGQYGGDVQIYQYFSCTRHM